MLNKSGFGCRRLNYCQHAWQMINGVLHKQQTKAFFILRLNQFQILIWVLFIGFVAFSLLINYRKCIQNSFYGRRFRKGLSMAESTAQNQVTNVLVQLLCPLVGIEEHQATSPPPGDVKSTRKSPFHVLQSFL